MTTLVIDGQNMELFSYVGVTGLPINFPIPQYAGFFKKMIKIAFQKHPILLSEVGTNKGAAVFLCNHEWFPCLTFC